MGYFQTKKWSFIWYFSIAFVLLFLSSSEKVSSQPLPSKQTDYLKNGIANIKEENYEEAMEDLVKARELDSNSSTAAYYLGIAYKKIQDYSKAKVNLKDALLLEPKVKEAVVELADVLYQLGETEEALKELESAEREGIESAQTSFLKGLILSALGKRAEAIESFKKSKSLDEKLTTSADYQIAMATLQEGNLSEAREILKEIVIRDPNADIAQFANQYIEAITKRIKEERPYRWTAGIQYQHDSNVLLKPGDVQASAGISGESDSAAIINLRAEYVPRLKAPFGLKTQYSLYQSLYGRLTSYDVQSHSIAIVPNYNRTGGSISLFTSYNLTRVDNLDYLKTLTLSPTYTFFISKTQFATLSAKYQDKKYVKAPTSADEDREGSDTNIGISWFYLIFENEGFINGRYEYNREDVKGKNWKYSGNRFGLSLLSPLPLITQNLTLNLGGEAYSQDFDNTHTIFLKKREDKTYTFNTMISYKVHDDIALQLQYIYIRDVSNISVYDYNKNMVTIGVEGRF